MVSDSSVCVLNQTVLYSGVSSDMSPTQNRHINKMMLFTKTGVMQLENM